MSESLLPQSRPQPFRDADEYLPGGRFGGGNRDRDSLVAANANVEIEGNLAEERDLLAFSFCMAAAMAKNFHPLTRWGHEITHVLDDAQDGHVHLFKHPDAFAHYSEGGFLRSGHDHAAIQWHSLAKRELGIA